MSHREEILPTPLQLSSREWEILRLLAEEGLTNQQIAKRVNLSVSQIEAMLGGSDLFRSIYLKIDASNRAQAVSWYFKEKIKTLSRNYIDSLADFPLQVYQLRTRGHPSLAIEWAQAKRQQLYQALRTSELPDNHFSVYLELLGKILYEIQASLKEVTNRNDIKKTILPLSDEMKKMGEKYNSNEILGLGLLSEADTYYLLKDYSACLPLLENAKNLITDPDNRLVIYRDLALCYGYTGDSAPLAWIEHNIRETIEDGSFKQISRACTALEGLSRAQGLLHINSAYKTFEQARSLYLLTEMKNKRSIVREIQLARSEVELYITLQPNEKRSIEKAAANGIELAKANGYAARAKSIENLVSIINIC